MNAERATIALRPWARSGAALLAELGADAARGLDPEEVQRCLQRFGPNRLREAERRSLLSVLGAQFRSVIVALLGAAALVSLALDPPIRKSRPFV